ncbi:ketoacyl-ACP synthase III family protein [Plantactinospora sp. KBS50]|uniref:ketoacyl-ACP synthase III family protein n=1 Tax=Plantactinospora sp. KBS50 TaxID=2024580 RepID=UPI0012FD7560|nr:ketoacyl-ACP synthase III family protein [Plantactinospora sp. KBS50]
MRWDNLYLAGLGHWLPDAVSAREAVDAGLLDAERFKTLGYTSVCVGEDVAPPDMAVRAVRAAVQRAGVTPRDVALLLHGSLWFQGLDIWPTASYVADRTGHPAVPALDVQQRCNVGLGAIELAAGALGAAAGTGAPGAAAGPGAPGSAAGPGAPGSAAGPGAAGSAAPGGSRRTAAIVSTADRFAAPAVDRWNMHDFNVYGDGATAMVLSTRAGFARIRSTATVADNGLEGQTRGDAPFTTASPAASEPIDLLARSGEFGRTIDHVQTSVRIGRVLLMARNAALKEAGLKVGQIRRVVTPATGRLPGDAQLHDLLGVPEAATTWEYGRTTGHVGGGDWALGLEYLLRTGGLTAGDHALLLGGGAGYTCTAVVVEILETPEWT